VQKLYTTGKKINCYLVTGWPFPNIRTFPDGGNRQAVLSPERVTRGFRRCVRDRPGVGEDRLHRLCGRQEPQRGGHPVSSREKHRVPGDGSFAQHAARDRARGFSVAGDPECGRCRRVIAMR
jgi:hypothetical protein